MENEEAVVTKKNEPKEDGWANDALSRYDDFLADEPATDVRNTNSLVSQPRRYTRYVNGKPCPAISDLWSIRLPPLCWKKFASAWTNYKAPKPNQRIPIVAFPTLGCLLTN
jgi:hypothetical protein